MGTTKELVDPKPVRRHLFTLSMNELGGGDRDTARREFAQLVLDSLRNAVHVMQGPHKKPPALTDKYKPQVILYFNEKSTRTKESHKVAAGKVCCEVNDIDVDGGSAGKGECVEDTMDTLAGYGPSAIVMRDRRKGDARRIAAMIEKLEGSRNWMYAGTSIISGGEGDKTHPTQVILDGTTMFAEDGFADKNIHITSLDQWKELDRALESETKGELIDRICRFFDQLKIAFIGDSAHSRIVGDYSHLAEYFDTKYLFVGPSQLRVAGGEPSINLQDVIELQFPIVYALRTQLERLIGTEDAPQMGKQDAIELISQFVLDETFLKAYDGKVYHARPRDEDHPMIPLHIKDQEEFPNIRFMMQSFMGVPTRMAVFQRCWAHRYEKNNLFPEPSVDLSLIELIKSEPYYDHQQVLNEKSESGPRLFASIEEGVALDRVESERWLIHDDLLYKSGAYGAENPDNGRRYPASRNDNLFSEDRKVYKATIGIFGAFLTPLDAAVHGLVSSGVRFSIMRKNLLGEHAKGSYTRVEFPIPDFTDLFKCLDPDCYTNRFQHLKHVKCIHKCTGIKGEDDEYGWPKVKMKCVDCEREASAREVILHTYGEKFLRPSIPNKNVPYDFTWLNDLITRQEASQATS